MSSRRTARSRTAYSEESEPVPDFGGATDEEHYDEDSEVTRCVCGNDELQPPHHREDPSFSDEMLGLFIQCEQCAVWQHGYCVGLKSEAAVPEKYWCERCHPDMHTLVFRGDRKLSVYDARREKRKPKRRDDAKKSERLRTLDKEAKRADRTRAMDKEYEQDLKKALEESARLVQAKQEAQREAHPDSRPEASPRVRVEAAGEPPAATAKAALVDTQREVTLRVGEAVTRVASSLDERSIAKLLSSQKRPRRTPESERQPVAASSSAPSTATADTSRTIDTSVDTPLEPVGEDEEHRRRVKHKPAPKLVTRPSSKPSANGLEDADKPCKPRLPQAKVGLGEMRKRVSAILEFIGRTQVELASEATIAAGDGETGAEFEQASLELYTLTERLGVDYRETFGVMDRLTRKLLLWEQRYGKYSH